MQRHGALLFRIERQFGVPATLLMAIWTMETDNGTGDMGKLPVIRTLATLAHDCRRTRVCSRATRCRFAAFSGGGDLPLVDLVGAYAGEIGQTQFLPSSYIKYGVDYDGNGRVDLRHSVPDVLASTANLLKVNGWRAGAPVGAGTENFTVMHELESRRDLSKDLGAVRRAAARVRLSVYGQTALALVRTVSHPTAWQSPWRAFQSTGSAHGLKHQACTPATPSGIGQSRQPLA